MRSTINKEQSQELRQVLIRYKVSKETIELLLSSRYASNTYKAYKQKKRIQTDNDWVIHFGANWAKAPDETTEMGIARSSGNSAPPPERSPEEAIDEITQQQNRRKQESAKGSEDLASRTIQSIVSFIKKPKPKEVPPPVEPKKPRMLKVALEIDEEVLIKLKKLADSEGIPLSALIRLILRKYAD